jgi:SAM-dependent methyltransferase
MNEIIRLKYQDIQKAIRSGRIVDEGCADGALLAEISRDFPDSDLFGIDLSSEFASRFLERQRAGEFGGAYVHFFHRNLFDRVFQPESIDTTICNSTLHEIWSYGDGETSVRSYLAEKLRQLRPGGRLLIRDVVGPEDGEREVLLWCSDKDGQNLSAVEIIQHKDRDTEWPHTLSTRGRFILFAKDFLGGQNGITFEEESHLNRPMFRLTLRQAAEFLSKKDYTDNWSSEMNEEFCFWNFSKWKQVLTEIGFQIIENPNNEAEGSRVYTNPWIVEHRHAGHVEVMDLQGQILSWPPTNMVLIAERQIG